MRVVHPLCSSLLLASSLLFSGCATPVASSSTQRGAAQRPRPGQSPVEAIRRALHDERSKEVLVVAHRACWKGRTKAEAAPENSLPAIAACVRLGVDIIEIDVRRSKDGHYVLMHDATVDRTTNGKGAVAELTLARLRALKLRYDDGRVSDERVPTLREALAAVRGKALLNLDKCFGETAGLHAFLRAEGALDHVLFKGRRSLVALQRLLKPLTPRPLFMPVFGDEVAELDKVDKTAPGRVFAAVEALSAPMVELIFTHPNDPMGSKETFAALRKRGARVWVNTLWEGKKSGGRGDYRAVKEPQAVWGWLLERGVDTFQTDEPRALLRFLRAQKRHR